MDGKIVVSRRDVTLLRTLLRSVQARAAQDRAHWTDLDDELDRAVIVDEDALPADRVALNSNVVALDLDSNICRVYSVVAPAQADPAKGRISVLAPLGAALLGVGVGDEVQWPVPGGRLRMRVEAVRQSEQLTEVGTSMTS